MNGNSPLRSRRGAEISFYFLPIPPIELARLEPSAYYLPTSLVSGYRYYLNGASVIFPSQFGRLVYSRRREARRDHEGHDDVQQTFPNCHIPRIGWFSLWLVSESLSRRGFLYSRRLCLHLANKNSDSGIITPSLALRSFLGYFGNPSPAVKGAIVSVYQAGGKSRRGFDATSSG